MTTPQPRLYASYREVRADITESIIESAVPQNSSHCMIADGIKAKLPEVRQISVDLATIRFTDPRTQQRYIYLTPRAAQLKLIQFDQGEPVTPFRFVLRGAAQVVRAGANAQKKGGRKLQSGKRGRGMTTTRHTSIPTKTGGTAIPLGALSNRGGTRGFGLKHAKP